MVVTLIFLAVLIGGMVIGMPIAQALVLTGVALMWHLDFFDSQLLAQNLQAGFDNFPLLAVPFFMLAGEIMNAGGLSRRIVNFARMFLQHRPQRAVVDVEKIIVVLSQPPPLRKVGIDVRDARGAKSRP